MAHRRMRSVIEQYAELKPAERAALPADVLDDARRQVFPSEFADYHEGVLAYSIGEHAKARAAWERLLARPEAERHYRSVQTAFMIGVLAVVENWDDGPCWFALARELAARGFHDDAGLAAATYGRESQWHAARGELRAAAEDALRSISAGYPTRRFLQPDEKSPESLAKFAADPLLRRVYTSLLLAEVTGIWEKETGKARLAVWLGAIEESNARNFAGAERVAWLCYWAGDYRAASRWLERAPQDDTHTLWLKGKLAAREGRKSDALRALSAATRLHVSRVSKLADACAGEVTGNRGDQRRFRERVGFRRCADGRPWHRCDRHSGVSQRAGVVLESRPLGGRRICGGAPDEHGRIAQIRRITERN